MVDDGSTDETQQWLAANDDPRVRVFRHEESRGVAAARNTGIREARAEWVAFCDDDDIWAPQKLRKELDALAESGADFCYAEAVVLDEEARGVFPDQPAPSPDALPSRLLTGNVLPGGASNVVVKTAMARELGGFDERLSHVEDWDLWLRLADSARGVHCPEVLVAYRWHGENATARGSFEPRAEVFRYFTAKQQSVHGRAFRPLGYARWLAGEAPSRVHAAKVHIHAGIACRSPGDIARSLAVLIGGRAAMRVAARIRAGLSRRRPAPPLRPPEWLEPT